jgi:hypothetical protein
MGPENLAPAGVRTPDFQPVAGRYTEYAIPAAMYMHTYFNQTPHIYVTYVEHICTIPPNSSGLYFLTPEFLVCYY